MLGECRYDERREGLCVLQKVGDNDGPYSSQETIPTAVVGRPHNRALLQQLQQLRFRGR